MLEEKLHLFRNYEGDEEEISELDEDIDLGEEEGTKEGTEETEEEEDENIE